MKMGQVERISRPASSLLYLYLSFFWAPLPVTVLEGLFFIYIKFTKFKNKSSIKYIQ